MSEHRLNAGGTPTAVWATVISLAAVGLAVAASVPPGTGPEVGEIVPNAEPAASSTDAQSAARAPASAGGGLSSLLFLKGQRVPVSYSPGSLDRAVRLQARFELQAAEFAKWASANVGLSLYLLSPDEWKQANLQLPLGIPVRLSGNILAMPAWTDQSGVELWQRLLGAPLPHLDPRPLRGTPAEAASLVLTDLLAQAEGARMLLEGAGISGTELWVGEVMAQSVARSIRERYPVASDASTDDVYAGIRRSRAALPLSAYTAGLSMEDWLWFQAVFHEAAARLSRDSGKAAAKALLRVARKRGGRLAPAHVFDRFPELLDWYRDSFAPAGAGLER